MEKNDYSIRKVNLTLLKSYRDNILEECSQPLLVPSNDEFKSRLDSNYKIMYIGKENPKWMNNFENPGIEEIEQHYENYLIDVDTREKERTKKLFWDFFRIYSSGASTDCLIWANAYLGGSKYLNKELKEKDKIKDMSLTYLKILYDYFKPDCVVIVSGPEKPYSNIVADFLNFIGSNIKYIPTKNYPLQYDEKLNVYYTYHPEFLNREYLFDDVSAKIKKLIDINKCKKTSI